MKDSGLLLKNPIIFFGTGRSGTTIISEMLFQHMHLAWPSNYQELCPPFPSINYMRRVFDNRFWRLIGKKKGLHGSVFYNRLLFKPGENYGMWQYLSGDEIDFSRGFLLSDKASPDRRELIRHYFAKMTQAQGKKRLAFKITGPPRMGYLLSIFPDAVFIHIKRKTIPTISSLLKVGFWKTRGETRLWWTGPYTDAERKWAADNKGNPEVMTAFQLKKIYWAEQREIADYNPKILRINYEDFTENPAQEIGRMIDFCDLPADPRIGEYLERNPIIPRNRPDEEYFGARKLERIDRIMREG